MAAIIAGAITGASTPVVIRALEAREVIDRPTERSSHVRPTVRGGGIAPAAGATVGAGIALTADVDLLAVIVLGALVLAILGLRDDLGSLSAGVRLAVQAGVAAAICVPLVNDMADGAALALLAAGGWLWLVAYVNAFNFMDGINGIAAAQVTVAGTAWALVGWWQDIPLVSAASLVIAAAALAFAPFNFPNARVFLGDVGSYFFGAWIGATALVGLSHGLTLEMAAAPLAIYVADTGSTLARRVWRRESLTSPHRDHVYQRLVINGWSHTRTTLVVAGAMICSAAFGALSQTGDATARAIGAGGIAATIATYLAAPHLQRSQTPPTPDRISP